MMRTLNNLFGRVSGSSSSSANNSPAAYTSTPSTGPPHPASFPKKGSTTPAAALLLPEVLASVGHFLTIKDLGRCILVSRTFHETLLPQLWHTISLTAYFRSWCHGPSRLQTGLMSKNALLVKTLKWDANFVLHTYQTNPPGENMVRTFLKIVDQQCWMQEEEQRRLQQQQQQQQLQLQLEQGTLPAAHQLLSSINTSRRLQALHLSFVQLTPSFLEEILPLVPGLVTLNIGMLDRSEQWPLLRIVEICPNLQHLIVHTMAPISQGSMASQAAEFAPVLMVPGTADPVNMFSDMIVNPNNMSLDTDSLNSSAPSNLDHTTTTTNSTAMTTTPLSSSLLSSSPLSSKIYILKSLTLRDVVIPAAQFLHFMAHFPSLTHFSLEPPSGHTMAWTETLIHSFGQLCPLLTFIRIGPSYGSEISESIVVKILQTFPNLKSLKIPGCNFGVLAFEALKLQIEKIEELDISFSRSPGISYIQLETLLMLATNLRVLDALGVSIDLRQPLKGVEATFQGPNLGPVPDNSATTSAMMAASMLYMSTSQFSKTNPTRPPPPPPSVMTTRAVYSPRPWACKRLKSLRIGFATWHGDAVLMRQMYHHLSQFLELEKLYISPGHVQLSFEGGIQQLSSLKRLKRFDAHGLTTTSHLDGKDDDEEEGIEGQDVDDDDGDDSDDHGDQGNNGQGLAQTENGPAAANAPAPSLVTQTHLFGFGGGGGASGGGAISGFWMQGSNNNNESDDDMEEDDDDAVHAAAAGGYGIPQTNRRGGRAAIATRNYRLQKAIVYWMASAWPQLEVLRTSMSSSTWSSFSQAAEIRRLFKKKGRDVIVESYSG